jgi:outer membrane receptor protein involved in Fe transport
MNPLRHRLFRASALLGVLLFTLAAACLEDKANAQGTTAQIVGKVVDRSGAVIPGATVTTENIGTNLGRTVTSSESGEYVISSLPVGSYRVRAVAPGFKTFSQSGIVLEGGQQARLDVSMQVGSTSETIEVTGNAVQVDTNSASLRTEVDSTQIRELPLNTRNTLQLLTLVPGVGNAASGGAASSSLPAVVTNQRSGPTLTVNGSRVNGSVISLDGAILVTALYNRPANLTNPDSIGEFSLITNNAGAEYGHASGGAFVAISKSGTNAFHGSVWEFFRNDALNARNWFAPAPAAKPILKQNQFGAAVGGPVWKDKAFFFATYEGLRIHQVVLQNLSTLTPAERAGDFSAIAKQLVDPATGLPYPRNQIPQSQFDPLSVGFMNTYIPVASGTTGLFSGQFANPVTGDQFTGRADYRVTKQDLAYVRFFRVNNTTPTFAGNNVSYTNFSSPNQGLTGRDTHTFSNNLIGDFGYSHTNLTTNGAQQGTVITPQQMGGKYATDGFNVSPQVIISGAGNFASGYNDYENTALNQIDAKLSWIKGKHLFQFGFLGLHIAEDLNWPFTYTSGNPTFSGAFTGNALADYLIGRPISWQQNVPFTGSEKTWNYSFFAQDDWKITPRLTVNLGLRYDLMVPWKEAGLNSATVTFNPNYKSTRIPTAPPGLGFAGDPGIPDGLIAADKTNFAPRLGFAYDVLGDGRTAVRGGYGIFYNAPGAITQANGIEAPPFQPQISFTPNTFSNPYGGTGITNPFPYTFNPSNPLFPFPSQYYAPEADLKNAFMQQYNLNVQHEFLKDLLVQVGYVGGHGNRLWYGHQANAAPYSAGGSAANAQARRPFFPQYYAGITAISDIGFSNYNSLQVTARKRVSSGLTMQLAYTFSKSLDAGSFADVDGSTEQDPYNLIDGEYARSDFNQKNLLRINGVWTLPQFRSLGMAHYLLGGWGLSGLINYSSGTPFSISTGAPAPWLGAGRDIGNLRLNRVHDPCAGCGSRTSWARTGYFDQTAYATPATGTFGNSGRNSMTGPSYFDTDASAVKNFAYRKREGANVQLRADFFNLFNNVQFNNPSTSNSSAVFGRVTSAAAARQIQLALRVSF